MEMIANQLFAGQPLVLGRIACKHFSITELVPSHIYEKWGDKAWMFIDPRLCVVLDELREQIGAITINSSRLGRNWSGLRTAESKYFSETSQHTYGRAADCIGDWLAEKVRQKIISGEIRFSFPVTLELGVYWLHIDVRNSVNRVSTVSI